MNGQNNINTEVAPLLNAQNLLCERGERVLFANLSLSLYAHQALHVRGVNGSGKTSLLRILCGLLPAVEGEIYWCGRDVRHCQHEYRAQLAYVGHKSGIKAELTAQENLRTAQMLLAHAPACSPTDALDRLGLANVINLPCGLLSAGQQQRVALARLLVSGARVWILDEPFTALDQNIVALVSALIVEHVQAGGAVMLTSHQVVALPGIELNYFTLN